MPMDTSKVRVPKKIENDGLVNAIIYIQYKSDYNELFIDSKLNDLLTVKNQNWEMIYTPNAGKIVGGVQIPTRFFANPIYKIQITSSLIAFNFVNKYPGWEAYRSLIVDVCSFLDSFITIEELRINYVSVYNNIKIFDYLDGVIKLNNLPSFYGTQYNFRCAVGKENNFSALATLSLTNEDPIPNSFTNGKQNVRSIVNITVEGKLSDKSFEDYLDFLHTTEKDLFFRIVNQDFVDHHNPTY